MTFFLYDHLDFRYEPFPIGLAKPLMEENVYKELLDNYPSIDLFENYQAMGKPGNKYTLSEKENRRVYNDFVGANKVWKEFYQWIKSDDFIYGVMDALRIYHIDLGYKRIPATKNIKRRFKEISRGQLRSRLPRLHSRFEFSALPTDNGQVVPHTDSPSKVVTIIVSMVREGEWDARFGGGTDVNRPKKTSLSFNELNRLADFDDMEVLYTYQFTPNQGIIFVKTFNSWHSVRPMTCLQSQHLRKTLTINIEVDR